MIEVPSFQFAKAGNQKEWLQLVDEVVFDPEMVVQFEDAINKLVTEEEFVLQSITNSSECEKTKCKEDLD